MSCRYCEHQKLGSSLLDALSKTVGKILFIQRKPPFDPIKMRCFTACCESCNSCHHNLCCDCFKRGVRVNYKDKAFIKPLPPALS